MNSMFPHTEIKGCANIDCEIMQPFSSSMTQKELRIGGNRTMWSQDFHCMFCNAKLTLKSKRWGSSIWVRQVEYLPLTLTESLPFVIIFMSWKCHVISGLRVVKLVLLFQAIGPSQIQLFPSFPSKQNPAAPLAGTGRPKLYVLSACADKVEHGKKADNILVYKEAR